MRVDRQFSVASMRTASLHMLVEEGGCNRAILTQSFRGRLPAFYLTAQTLLPQDFVEPESCDSQERL